MIPTRMKKKRSINYMGYPYFFSEFQCSSLDYMPVPHPRRELLPDGAFKERAKYYLELLRAKNPEAFDSLHGKILEWKSEKRPSKFPDLLRDFAKDLNYPEKSMWRKLLMHL